MGATRIVLATIKPWHIAAVEKMKLKHKEFDILLFTKPSELTIQALSVYQPEWIFFPHWSWKIPADITNNFKCVLFHMTDLPFGRGGSPLQNLIKLGFKSSCISAISVEETLDSGDVYMKLPLSLEGRAEDIFIDVAKKITEEMIPFIVKSKPVPVPQTGKITSFKRLTEEDNRIREDMSLSELYDHIRMVDAPSYPHAFIDLTCVRITFDQVTKNGGQLSGRFVIKEK